MTQVPGVTWDNGMKEDKLDPAVVHACRRWPVGNMKNYISTCSPFEEALDTNLKLGLWNLNFF